MYTTRELGFAKVQENPLYCAMSRGKFELMVLQSLSQVMMTIAKFANDLIWFTTQEFWFFDLPNSFKTWSSAMPNKKNFDVLELLRWNYAIYLWYEHQLQYLCKNLFSWYNRDLQLSKEPFIKALNLLGSSLDVVTLCVDALLVNDEALSSACIWDITMLAEVYALVKQWVPFREAYFIIKNELP
jgi:argininosuccinate lyase